MDDPTAAVPTEREKPAMFESDDEALSSTIAVSGANPPPSSYSPPSQRSKRRSILGRSMSRSIHSPTGSISAASQFNSMPAPASPPTPAPSPPPREKERCPDWSTVDEGEEGWMKDIRRTFQEASVPQRERLLTELLNMCNSRQLNFVHDYVSPRLKKDPFTTLPNEICLRVSLGLFSENTWQVLDPMMRCHSLRYGTIGKYRRS